MPAETIAERKAASERVRATCADLLDLPYGDNERQQVDLFLPNDGDSRPPLLVYIHGGYWQTNHKNDYAFLAPSWLQRGVAFATLGYRLLPDVQLADIVADVRNAICWLFANAERLGVDSDRFALSGLSAGAHLVATYVAHAGVELPRAALLLSGVYDLPPLESTSPGQALTSTLAADIGDISPLHLDAPRAGRYLVAWGDQETTVFESQSTALASYWVNRGTDVRSVSVTGVNHFTILDRLRGDADSDLTRFIDEALLAE